MGEVNSPGGIALIPIQTKFSPIPPETFKTAGSQRGSGWCCYQVVSTAMVGDSTDVENFDLVSGRRVLPMKKRKRDE